MTKDSDRPDPCWSKLPVYRPGGKLSAEQLTAGQDDTLLRDRLLTRALHGIGVVFGLDIETTDDGQVKVCDNCIHIGCGLALDRHGRMLYWPGGRLCYDDLIGCKPSGEGCYTLKIHYAERPDKGGWDRCHEGADWMHRCVVFSLEEGCEPHDPCPDDLPDDLCLSRRDYVCARTGQWPSKEHAARDLEHACEPIPPLDESECTRFGYARDAGIALACVPVCDLDRDKDHCPPRMGFCDRPVECGERAEDAVEAKQEKTREEAGRETAEAAVERLGRHAEDPGRKHDAGKPGCGCEDEDRENRCRARSCDVRQVAYRSPLLYELLNDTDVRLARVLAVGWKRWVLGRWEDRMPLSEFKARTEACMTDCDGAVGDASGLPWMQGFAALFSRPVRADTLHPMSVTMDVWIRDNEIDPHCDDSVAQVVGWTPQRVPVEILPLAVDDRGLAHGVRICPSGSWVRLRRKHIDRCANSDQHARVEITFRGQTIRDACGCMLDARPPDLTCRDHCGTKTGQARPGGDLVMAFRVGPDPQEDDETPDEGDDSTKTGGSFIRGRPSQARPASDANGETR